MAARAVYKLAEHALVDPRAPPPAEYCPMLLSCAAAGMLLTLYNTPFFATLGWAGLCNVAYHHPRLQAGCGGRARALALGLLVAGCVGNTAYVAARGALAPRVALAAGSSIADPLASVFVTGLLAGCTTFGGAFTAVPCVRRGLGRRGWRVGGGRWWARRRGIPSQADAEPRRPPPLSLLAPAGTCTTAWWW